MFRRIALVIAGWLVALFGVSLAVTAVAWFAVDTWFFRPMQAQMAAGRAYMDSLNEKDIPVWIECTEKLLSQYQTGHHISGSQRDPIPSDLSELKIIGIHISGSAICYVWMGGFDHTELQVSRLENGTFQLVAQYNDVSRKVIWPKE